MDPKILTTIREQIRTYIASTITHAVARGGATVEEQSLEQNQPGGPKMQPRPVAHPYGFASRAPDGTLVVTGRIGEHPGARMTLLHRDPKRTQLGLESGESAIYSLNLHGVWAKTDKTLVGGKTADNPVPLGTELLELLGEILDVLIAGDFVLTTSPGNPTAPNPAKTPALQQLKSKYITTADTNVVSQTVFTTRQGGA